MRTLLAVLTLLLALAGPAVAERVLLSGEVTYRERIALPPGATLSVSLIDLAAPARSRISASAPIASPGQVPLTFNLGFDESIVLPGNSYALNAEIIDAGGRVVFRNAEPYAVAPLALSGPISILVGRVVAADAPPPVAEPVPEAAPEPPALPPILDVTWRVEAIDGAPVVARSTVSLSIGRDMRAGGRGGCNSWFSQARVAGETLAFSAVAATRMACTSDALNGQEQRFFAALDATRFYRLDGEALLLLDANGRELVRLGRSRF